MKPGERAELERQGAKAAARGDTALLNPMLLLQNMPGLTGETLHEWGLRYDAWRAGYEKQGMQPAAKGWMPIRR